MNPYPYLVIDLKSFYASVECVERGLDPMTANLVVADPKRSAGTLCLAITPSMKRLGISNRCRLYEIPNHISYLVAEPRMKLYLDYSANIYGIYLKYISKEGEIDLKGLLEQTFGHNPGRIGKARKAFKH